MMLTFYEPVGWGRLTLTSSLSQSTNLIHFPNSLKLKHITALKYNDKKSIYHTAQKSKI